MLIYINYKLKVGLFIKFLLLIEVYEWFCYRNVKIVCKFKLCKISGKILVFESVF